MSNRLSPLNFVLLVIVGVLLIAASVVFFIHQITPLERLSLDVKFSVGNTIGFDTNRSLLSFGKLFPGGSAQRSVQLRNEHDFPVAVRAYASSSVTSYLSFQAPDVLSPWQNVSLPVTLRLPEDIPAGSYQGNVVFETRRFK